MNNASPEKKNSVLKTLAIAGFVAIIILIAWLSIQLVTVLPNAFNSLASLAESVSQYQTANEVENTEMQTLVVTSNTTLVNSGGTVDVSWDTARTTGSYLFSYQCADGVAVEILTAEGNRSIECDSNYNIGNTDSMTLAIDSEKDRYADLEYSVAFLETDATQPRALGEARLTIVNTSVSNVVSEDEAIEEIVDENVNPDVEVVVEETPEETPVTQEPDPTPTTPSTPTQPVYEQEYVYTIPTSDPNGRTDLTSRFLSTGQITNNRFTPRLIDEDESGAIQFEVKNIGTRTSEDWTFSVTLPGGGTYESTEQKPLKPNERAVLTIGFQAAGVSNHTFAVEIDTDRDRNPANNDFDMFVVFTN